MGSWATRRSSPRRWRGACRPSSRSATSTPPAGRSLRCVTQPSRRRSRSCSTWPSTTARPSLCATVASRRPRPGRCARTSGAGCSPGVTLRASFGIEMFSIRREQGRLAELAPVIRILAADASREGPWRPGLVSVLVELGMEEEARRELARVVAARAGPVPRVALARRARVPDRRVRGARRSGDGRHRLSRARAARGREHHDRPPGRLLRSGRSLSRHARRHARRMGACRGALRARHGAQPAHGGA